jgi:hypothetical protein
MSSSALNQRRAHVQLSATRQQNFGFQQCAAHPLHQQPQFSLSQPEALFLEAQRLIAQLQSAESFCVLTTLQLPIYLKINSFHLHLKQQLQELWHCQWMK